MLKLGTEKITALHLGGEKIGKAYLGERLVFGAEKKPSRLPEGYTEVEYIEAPRNFNSPYIDTGVKPGNIGRFQLKCSDISSYYAGTNIDLFGVYYDYYVNPSAHIKNVYAFLVESIFTNTQFRASSGIGQSVTSSSSSVLATPKYVNMGDIPSGVISIEINNIDKKCTINEATEDIGGEKLSTSIALTVFLFCSAGKSFNSTTISVRSRAQMKIYSCKINDYDDSPLRDFVPCIDPNGVVGLFDVVNAVFYNGKTSVAFEAGPAV